MATDAVYFDAPFNEHIGVIESVDSFYYKTSQEMRDLVQNVLAARSHYRLTTGLEPLIPLTEQLDTALHAAGIRQ